MIEGPQDKKASINLYYAQYKKAFPYSKRVEALLNQYLSWTRKALPNLRATRYRKPVDFYALVGAIDRVSNGGKRLSKTLADACGDRLLNFERQLRVKNPQGDAARYIAAASRQTDNLTPRTTRIAILEKLLRA